MRSLFAWRNPLIGREAGRLVMQVPYDGQIDFTGSGGPSAFLIDFMFQVPTGTLAIRRARVWATRKAFRAVAGSTTSNNPATPHNHALYNGGLTQGIIEEGPSGTFDFAVSDDGTNYTTLDSASSGLTDRDITSVLTRTAGTKRLRFTPTLNAIMRVQVLLVLDLRLAIFS